MSANFYIPNPKCQLTFTFQVPNADFYISSSKRQLTLTFQLPNVDFDFRFLLKMV